MAITSSHPFLPTPSSPLSPFLVSLQFSRKSTPGPSKPENLRGGGEEDEEENRPDSSLSTLPAVLSSQSLNEDCPQDIAEEEIVTGTRITRKPLYALKRCMRSKELYASLFYCHDMFFL